MEENNSKSKYYLLFPILLLGAFFIFKLIEQSQLIFTFPLDFNNDISSHIAKLFFLSKFGYEALVPYWYNGFYLFGAYPPGWYFFALPLQMLLNNLQLTTYISLLLLFFLAFMAIFFLGKYVNFSKAERVFFFIILFANPISIGNFIRLGRMPELTGWVIYLPIFFLILNYKNKRLDMKFFILLAVLLSLLILTHPSTTIFTFILILSLFLIKPLKEKLGVVISLFFSLIVTSFWWIPFILNSESIETNNLLNKIVNPSIEYLPDIVTTIFFPVMVLILFYFYSKECREKRKEIVFFSPVLIIALLLLLRVLVFVPFFSTIQPDSYNIFLLTISLFLFLKTPLRNYGGLVRRYLTYLLAVIAIVSVLVYLLVIPPFIKHTLEDEDTFKLLEDIKGKFLIVGHPTSYARAYYSFAPIYYNLSSPSGWMDTGTTEEHLKSLKSFDRLVIGEGDCNEIMSLSKTIQVDEIIVSNALCESLLKCNLMKKLETKNQCLLEFA